MSPASEVIRWGNQIAINRRDVIEASAARSVAEIALNRLLHRPLEEPFATAAVDLDDPALLANEQRGGVGHLTPQTSRTP